GSQTRSQEGWRMPAIWSAKRRITLRLPNTWNAPLSWRGTPSSQGRLGNLHLGNGNFPVGSRPQCLRNLASRVGIASPLICKGIENAELPRPKVDRIPFQGPFFIQRERLNELILLCSSHYATESRGLGGQPGHRKEKRLDRTTLMSESPVWATSFFTRNSGITPVTVPPAARTVSATMPIKPKPAPPYTRPR